VVTHEFLFASNFGGLNFAVPDWGLSSVKAEPAPECGGHYAAILVSLTILCYITSALTIISFRYGRR